jgi:hypothetical protein
VQRVRLRPPEVAQSLSGHVVLVRVADRWWLHRVPAEEDARVHHVFEVQPTEGRPTTQIPSAAGCQQM